MRKVTCGAVLLLTVVLASASAGAQGCSQCREQLGETPARTQAAYRDAIAVLVLAGTLVFGAGLFAIRRFR